MLEHSGRHPGRGTAASVRRRRFGSSLPRLVLAGIVLLASGMLAPQTTRAKTSPTPGACVDGVLPHGALSRICIPASGWNGDVVVWAHGYVAFNEPIGFYHLELPGGVSLPDLIQRLGFAFATTSYRTNGLAVLEGADDIRELVAAVPGVSGRAPGRTYIAGASEGGLITTLLVEQSPQLFSGGLAACGPIGDFQQQIDYIGDFRVLFDAYFPGVLPGSATRAPRELIDNWESVYVPAVQRALAERPDAARLLVRVGRAAVDPADPATVAETTINLLWYSAFTTNDAVAKLGGNPYGNRQRWYWGSGDDWNLNLRVKRFTADPAALAAVKRYQTSGRVTIPLVTLHTTGDEIIPYWHERLYRDKVRAAGGGKVTQIPSGRYGHCQFGVVQTVFAFATLVRQVTGAEIDRDTQRRAIDQSIDGRSSGGV